MYYLQTKASFDAAHFLAGYEGKCKNIHGHRWRVVVEIKTEMLHKNGQLRGMYVDFKQLKQDLNGLTDSLDHSLIIEQGSLKEKTLEALKEEEFRVVEVPFRPTAEHLSKYFYDKMQQLGYGMSCVTVYETPNNCASYTEC